MGSLMMMKFGDAGSLSFPDFDKILDFTSAGSESGTSVSVDGDTDKEYKIHIRNLVAASTSIYLSLNADTGNNYGYQYLLNNSGTITAARGQISYCFQCPARGQAEGTLLTPTGTIKTCYSCETAPVATTGTTVSWLVNWGWSWNNTASVTSLDFRPASGNFTAGTRIIVYRRRVNT